MATISRKQQANIVAVLGASGSGKTSYVMQRLKREKPKRLIIWDTKGEFSREGYATPVYTLAEAVKALQSKAFQVAYIPRGDAATMKKEFSLLCRAAFHAKALTLVAEELSDVTAPSQAPEGWRKCTSQGRSEGITVYGLSQQPASIDKHFFGNCSLVRTGRLNFGAHIKSMAECLGVDREDVRKLLPLEFIERDMLTGEVNRGKLTF
jgi:Cdc6-like AAA superfamily ATPase